MLVLQVPQTSLIHKMPTKRPLQGRLFIETFHCIFLVEEKLIWTMIWKNQEDLVTFLKGQDISQFLSSLAAMQCFYIKMRH